MPSRCAPVCRTRTASLRLPIVDEAAVDELEPLGELALVALRVLAAEPERRPWPAGSPAISSSRLCSGRGRRRECTGRTLARRDAPSCSVTDDKGYLF
jgi:hypothetical protein